MKESKINKAQKETDAVKKMLHHNKAIVSLMVIIITTAVLLYTILVDDIETEAKYELYLACEVPETNTSKIAYLNTSSHVFTGKDLVNLEETFGINVSAFDNSTEYGEYEWRDENGTCVLSVSWGGERIFYLNPDYLSLRKHDLPNKTEAVNLSLKYIQKIRGKIDDLYLEKVSYHTRIHCFENAPDTKEVIEVTITFRQRINGLPVLGMQGSIYMTIGANGSVLIYQQNTVRDIIHPKETHHHDPVNKTNYTTGKENVSIITSMNGYKLMKEYKQRTGKSEVLRNTRVTNITLAYYTDSYFSCPSKLYPYWIYHLKVRDPNTKLDYYGYDIQVNAVTGKINLS